MFLLCAESHIMRESHSLYQFYIIFCLFFHFIIVIILQHFWYCSSYNRNSNLVVNFSKFSSLYTRNKFANWNCKQFAYTHLRYHFCLNCIRILDKHFIIHTKNIYIYSSRYIVLKEEEKKRQNLLFESIHNTQKKALSLAREDVSSSEKISSVCD